MATATDATSAQTHRGFQVGALLFLGGATGLAFGRVFEGTGASLRLVAAGVLAVALAELLRRSHVLLSVLVSAAALLVFMADLVFPDTTWGLLPTLETLRAMGDALALLGREATREVAPAPPLPSLMTASLTAVWTAATASHALAVRSRSTVLPLLPPAALLTFAGVVTGDGPRPGYVAILFIGSVAVVLAVGFARLGIWGRVVGRRGKSGSLVVGTAVRWAGWLGVGALFIALILPGILPGYGSGAAVRVGSGLGDRVSISPIVDIRPNLTQTPARELFLVEADQPSYWRMVVLDRFDGRVWTASDLFLDHGSAIVGSEEQGVDVTKPLFGGSSADDVVGVTQTVEIRGLGNPWLPVAFEPEEIVVPNGEILRWDHRAGVVFRPDGLEEGFTYRVVSNLVSPTIEELRHAYDNQIIGPDSPYAPFKALPPGLPRQIVEEAREIGDRAPTRRGRAPTEYDRVLAIQEYLRGFTYDPNAPAGHGGDDIVNFLFTSRRGYCEQFAGTMAVMVRALGLPARVAVGFLQGTQLEDGRWRVTTLEAHAWPEVWFPGVGWVAFEPTPTRTNPTAGPYLGTGAPPELDPGGTGGRRGNRDEPLGIEELREQFVNELGRTNFEEAPVPPQLDRGGPGFPWIRLLLALLALVGVVALFALVAKPIVRRVALARGGPPDRAVRTAYRVFEATAADLGLARRPTETLGEFRDRLRSAVRLTDGHLDSLTSLAGMAMYAPPGLEPEEAAAAASAVRALGRDLRRQVGPLRTFRGSIRLAPPL
jgi:transglutaminase-like putative cysteine protease